MKRLLLLLSLTTVTVTTANACDLCGCSASNQSLGILPGQEWNFVGIQYQFNYFKSNYPSIYDGQPNVLSDDKYHTLQVWGRYNLSKRIQVFAFVPYRTNLHHTDSTSVSNSGIGDISALINLVILKTKPDQKWNQQLIAGGGIKLPTGKNVGITTLDREGLPNMQPGTGSWDFLLNANYTVSHKKIGFNIDASYSITTANKDQYKYGNKFNSGLLGFYALQYKNWKLLPQTGIRCEYALHDYDNYARRWLNEETGGTIAYATVGVQAFYKRIGVRITYEAPFIQHYDSGYVTAKQKFDAGLFLLFK